MAAVGAVPRRDLMAPPQLTGDAPVADILHPVRINFCEALRNKLRLAVVHDAQRLFGQRLHLYEPLGGDDRLDVAVAAVTGADIVVIRLDLHEVALLLKVGDDLLARLIAVKALILAAVLVDDTLIVEDADDLKVVAQADLKVVRVVSRRHLDAAGAEVHLGIVVRHDGDLLADERQDDVLADDVLVALVIWIDAHAGVAEHGLGPGRRDDDLAGAVCQRIAHMPQMSGLVDIFDLGIGQSRDAVRAPVDDAASLVDEALLIQVHEHLADGLRAALVHREAGTVPVAGRAEALLLLDDTVAVLMLPGPDALEELLAAEVITGLALLAQLLLHADLRGDTGMVHAGDPEGGIALHALEADEHVLHGGVHGMAHVELACDIGGRHDDGKGLLVRVAFGMEIAVVYPEFVEPVLNVARLVGLWQFFHSLLLFDDKNRPELHNMLRAMQITVVPPEFPPWAGTLAL